MKKITLSLCHFVTLSLFALCANAATVPMNNAELVLLNKASGKTATISAPVGTPVKHDKLEITVRACHTNEPFAPADDFAFVEIETGGEQIFSGWMIRSNPGYNPVQNADYDVWIKGCLS
ncbi:MAG: DUF2155 domain-containing protein [Rickettsiales bacterium]|jgi:hypothetical protein|nr:DUF2155 domain-containing protein [Rickettsiales bacterium]